MPNFPRQVKIVEVGPRDGLQNEPTAVPTETKIAFIKALAGAGLGHIEAGSFVHPKLVPQLADAEAVFAGISDARGPAYSMLVPNERGLDRALTAGVRRIAVFTAASETFTQKNIGMTIEESLAVFAKVISRALAAKVSVRAYLSTAFVCPFEGRMDKNRVSDLTQKLLALGADEVAISDTIGAAVPTDVYETVGFVLGNLAGLKEVDPSQSTLSKGGGSDPLRSRPSKGGGFPIALHFHDTYGTALANVLAVLDLGISTFDSSAGGLGGCPFAPGAAGNMATEDLLYMLHGMGIETGVRIERVVEAADMIASALGRPLRSAGWRRRYGSTSGHCAPEK